MNKYLKNLKHILIHKYYYCQEYKKHTNSLNPFKGILHDMDKFFPTRFISYSNWFYGKYGVAIKDEWKDVKSMKKYSLCKYKFKKNFEKHYKLNKHHWQHWFVNGESYNIPNKYLIQMLCDISAMSKEFGDTPQEYYLKNYDRIKMDRYGRRVFEHLLGLNDSRVGDENQGALTLKEYADLYDEETYNTHFRFINNIYNVDSYKLLKEIE